jgi:hypothetical protein
MPTLSSSSSASSSRSGAQFLNPYLEAANRSLVARLQQQSSAATPSPFPELLGEIPEQQFSDIDVNQQVFSPELLERLQNTLFAVEPSQAQSQFQGALRGVPGVAANSPSFIRNMLGNILRGARASRDMNTTNLQDRAAQANANMRLQLLGLRQGNEQQMAQQGLGRASIAAGREAAQRQQQTSLSSILAGLVQPTPFSQSNAISSSRRSAPGLTSFGGSSGFYA